MNETIYLKSCPFCGGDSEINKIHKNSGMDGSYTNWLIRCKKCGANMERAADDFYGRKTYTAEEAAGDWNKREK